MRGAVPARVRRKRQTDAMPLLQKNLQLPSACSSTQKMKAAGSPEMLVCDILDSNWRLFSCVFPKDLIEIICSLQLSMEHQSRRLRDLEDYLDTLLVRVMETTPRILQNPYVSCKTHAKLR
jgi:hypothetical protein